MLKGSESLRISVSELRAGMVVAHAVTNEAGIMLLPQSVVLSRGSYDLLKKHGVRTVYVNKDSIDENAPKFGGKGGVAVIPKRLGSEADVDLADYILAFGLGEPDASRFDEVTRVMAKKKPCKSDVFMYLDSFRDGDDYIFAHSANVAMLADMFGIWLGFDKGKLDMITMAGALHDVGKTEVPTEILNKAGALTDEETALVRNHPVYGYQILDKLGMPDEVKNAALMHHERDDGSGYPFGTTLAQVTEFSKIIMICDVYDAMTNARSYRRKMCPFDVIEELSGQANLDRELVRIFVQNLAYTYIGSNVYLTDGRVGEVVFVNNLNLARPMVRVGGEIIDLNFDTGVKVAEIL